MCDKCSLNNSENDNRELLNDPEFVKQILEHLKIVGCKHEDMVASGYTLIYDEDDEYNSEIKLAIETKPTAKSKMDTKTYAIRYRYYGPRNNKNRDFCAEVLDLDFIYRKEDIDMMSFRGENKEFSKKREYSIFKWKGSFNCLHRWRRMIYAKENGVITDEQIGNNIAAIPLTPLEKYATVVNPRVVPKSKTKLNDLINLKNNLSNMIVAKIIYIKGKSINKISLVEKPAVQVDFIRLFQDETKLQLNEELHEIFGPALIPSKYYGRNKDFFAQYNIDAPEGGCVYFDTETVKQMSIEYLNDSGLAINTNHDIDVNKDSYQLVSSCLIENENDFAYTKFSKDQCPVGTWMLRFKILDNQLWKDIKKGKYNGFSMEGSPDLMVVNDNVQMSEDFINDVLITEVVDNVVIDFIVDELIKEIVK